jgi:Tol biopolymer transport system component
MKRRRLALATIVAAITGLTSVGPATTAIASNDAPSTNGVIVWTTRADDGSEHLMTAHADGSHQHQLTPTIADTGDIDAQISPDGSWVAYEHDSGETATIHLVRPSGAGDHVVDVGCVDPCVAALSPTWLSNNRLAFTLVSGPFDPVTTNAASAVLWTANTDGTDVRRLSPAGIDGAYEEYYARSSRDGSYLTFDRVRNADGTRALFRTTPDGSSTHQLTPWHIAADVDDLSTAASGPTKDLIVFESYGRGDPNATFVDIATVPATCHPLSDCAAKVHWITDNGATGRRNANPQWSPDGSSLVFTNRSSIDDPNPDIWTMRYNGTQRRLISTSPNFDYRPTWGRR